MTRYDKTYCSQCGGEFGPGDAGYSHCSDHPRPALTAVQIKGALIADAMDYGTAVADELPKSQQMWLDAIKEKMALLENHAYAEGRKDQAEETAHRGYVLFGAGAYLLTICHGDERGPELVAHLATDDEKVGRTVGDLGDVVPDKEIPLERVAVRLQFASEAGLRALEQQLRMLRKEHFSPFTEAA